MIDHISLHVSDYSKGKEFFAQALAPLGYTVIMDYPEWKTAGLGKDGKPDFWISEKQPIGNNHVAISAESRSVVDAFYAAALEAGGKDNGAPGIRKDYHPNYYGAFVFDPDNNNIEAVCHKAE